MGNASPALDIKRIKPSGAAKLPRGSKLHSQNFFAFKMPLNMALVKRHEKLFEQFIDLVLPQIPRGFRVNIRGKLTVSSEFAVIRDE